MSLGTVSSGGEAGVRNQYNNKNDSAGALRFAGIGNTGAMLRMCRLVAVPVMVIAAVLEFTAGLSQAQQRVAFANAAHTATVMVLVGKSEDVHTDQPLVDITVGDPDIADVNPLTDHTVSILGKKIGTTRVTAYGEGKRVIGIFDVEVAYDVSRLNAEIAHVAGGGIRVSSVNGRILLSGTVADAVTLDKTVQIARQFVPDVVNTVQVLQAQQIMLEVRFVEADRQASRELGLQWNLFGGNTTVNVGNQVGASQLPVTGSGLNVSPTVATVSPTVAAGVLSGVAPFGFLVSQLTGGQNKLNVAVNALEQKGLARSLAEPNLVALSGDTASFLAGGQFYVPVPGALGVVTFAPQSYGVGLSFTPTVLRDGLINLVIKPEVSTLDTNNTVTIAGTSVPALIVRKASTTVELRDGQSFMLGGLLQNTSNTAQDQLPWVGDAPVIGALFRSSQYQKNETDLVILVTPHIVHPLPPSAPIRTPLDSSLPANDIDFFLMGQAEVSPALARLALGATNRPFVGHILDLPRTGDVYVSARN